MRNGLKAAIMKSSVISKNKARAHYLLMILSLNTGYLLCKLLVTYYSLFPPRKRKKGDVVFFPFTQRGSDGYKRRIEQYTDYFVKEGLNIKVCDVFNDAYIREVYERSEISRYSLFRRIFWIRFRQVYKASGYSAAFVQRGLFPLYPDQKYPHLERLLYKICKKVSLDFWDSVWVYNADFVNRSAKYCHQITCVNQYISDYFYSFQQPRFIFPIGVDVLCYKVKNDYEFKGPVRFVYTGNPANVDEFLGIMTPILLSIAKEIDFVLVFITRGERDTGDIKSEFYPFDETTFYDILSHSDIGLYAVENSEISHGKMAMKVLDYFASALPVIGTPYGLAPGMAHNENMLYARSQQEWSEGLRMLCKDVVLRKRIGTKARYLVETQYSLQDSYRQFKKIILAD